MSDTEAGEYKKHDSRSPKNHETSRSHSKSVSRSRSGSIKSGSARRSYTRSRSRSRSYRRRSRSGDRYSRNGRSRGRYNSRSRSRSRSRSGGRRYTPRRYSRSPMSSRKRHIGDRLNPPVGKCLGVFGLSLYTTESDLRNVFSRYGRITSINVVIDQKTGRSRGFGFVYFEREDDASDAKEKANGMELDGRRIRVDFSITARAHTPTPGVYVGRPYSRPPPRDEYRCRDDYREHSRRDYRRTPSPYYSRRRSPSPYYRESYRDRSPYRERDRRY